MADAPRGMDLDRFKPAAGTKDGKSAGPSIHHVPPGPASDPFSIVAKERRVQEVLASVENLASLPTVVIKALALTNSRDSQASDFESVIRKDQALAAKVLKLANSPFFGLRSKVTSIAQAVVVLGIKTMKSVVVAAKTSKLLNQQLTPYGYDDAGMWKHSISCAAVSRLVAKKAGLGGDVAEELFVAGLLHDVGKTIVAPHIAKFPDEFSRAYTESGDLCATEKELVGISHAEVGGRMAKQWHLDGQLQELIGGHHDPEAASPAMRVLQVANDLCNQLGIGRAQGPRA
ncbi:MAG: HDOD domain-containing protein, partial [Gemmatimonadetes bacterium]|nr:HDOD domain-containing protein [Gemmatimonadota bacterium]